MAVISIIQSAKATGNIVTDGTYVTATFDAPVGEHSSVIVVVSVAEQHPYEQSIACIPQGLDYGSLAQGVLAQAWPVGTTSDAIGEDGEPTGSGTIADGPSVVLFLLQDSFSNPIEGLTQVSAGIGFAYSGETKVAMYEVSGLDTFENLFGNSHCRFGSIGVSGTTDALPLIHSYFLANQPPALFMEVVFDSSNTGDTFTSSADYEFTDNLNADAGSVGVIVDVFDDDPGSYGGDTITSSNSSTDMMMVAVALDPPAYTPPPPPAPPLRYKRVPLTLDFANTTWDQQNRLTQYELYRSCGLDQVPWAPPVTITVTAWSEAVDDDWSVLKKVMRGEVITIDPSVSAEWAGDYEVMETTYNPFQGDASQFSTEGGGDPSTVVGSGTLASPADQNAGTIILKLRTYNPGVFIDVSQTPSYVDLPGPIEGDPEA